MRKITILLTICCLIAACKKNEVTFTYSPDAPRAGEAVKFSNLSTSGEEWEWTFGDGSTSSIKSPTHTFKQPGTYRVQLKVDKKNAWTYAKDVTVYDTVPTFVCSDSVFYIYQDYTFTANLYNPYNYSVAYFWYAIFLPPDFVVTDTTMTNKSLHLYFTRPTEEASIGLSVTLNNVETNVVRTFNVQDRPAHSVLIRTDEGDLRQRIFGVRAEDEQVDFTAAELLDAEQDTMQTYNGYTFYLSELRQTFPELEGFHIANRKVYFRTTNDGLWVAHIDGTDMVQIDERDCFAMTLDMQDSRIYWANEQGVWYMPFVGSDNNKFITTPVQLNAREDASVLAVDTVKRYSINTL